ncbi:MAG: hypothetical protein JSR77_05485 [Planctomycetes bacterium]|nr:hypothetical protein [Planctomycetota bacterium]
MTARLLSAVVCAVAMLVGISGCAGARPPADDASWRRVLTERLAAFGHRNIIAIVDSAYPAQSKPGVEMICTGADQLTVVRAVLDGLAAQRHVKPEVFTDAELLHVAEADAPGISAYRDELNRLLKGVPNGAASHEKIIAELDETSRTFKVLLLKTSMALPYTSVFVRLDCGYWNAASEQRLRDSMAR